MSKKGKIVAISLLIGAILIPILFIVKSFAFSNESDELRKYFVYGIRIYVCVWVLISLIFVVLFVRENSSVQKATLNKSTDEQIEYWLNIEANRDKYFVISSTWVIGTNLGVLYLRKNEVQKAKDYLSNKIIYRVSYAAYYPLFIIAVYEDNQAGIEQFYALLMKVRDKRFAIQKEKALLIKKMIETKEYNPSITTDTQFQILRDICARYQVIEE